MENNIVKSLLLMAIFSATTSNAEMVVIADKGGIPISKVISSSSFSDGTEKTEIKSLHSQYPITTKSMTVGRVTESEANINYSLSPKPMFIIGYDVVSINWLKENRDFLADKSAVGFVINVDNDEQMRELDKIAGADIVMQPMSGEGMARNLNIRHYPFYMDSNGVLR